jgi:hypothetical protein
MLVRDKYFTALISTRMPVRVGLALVMMLRGVIGFTDIFAHFLPLVGFSQSRVSMKYSKRTLFP